MLARRLPTILPAMTRDEALEVTMLHSVAGVLAGSGLTTARPFRAPHHSVSLAGLLGGGSGFARPGEVSLAHNGVLFLDELNEFRRDAIEALRQPLEDGRVVVTRVAGAVEFPARFTLVAWSDSTKHRLSTENSVSDHGSPRKPIAFSVSTTCRRRQCGGATSLCLIPKHCL